MKKGEHVENTKSLLDPEFFFLFIHDLPFSPGHLLESEGRFVNLFGDFSPLCASICSKLSELLGHEMSKAKMLQSFDLYYCGMQRLGWERRRRRRRRQLKPTSEE